MEIRVSTALHSFLRSILPSQIWPHSPSRDTEFCHKCIMQYDKGILGNAAMLKISNVANFNFRTTQIMADQTLVPFLRCEQRRARRR